MKPLELVRKNLSYAFFLLGVVWLVIAAYTGYPIVIWPVATCVVAGLLLRLRPSERFTWAWMTSTAAMGLIIAAYQAYYWLPFIGGSLNALAALTAGGFAVFALVHLVMLFLGGTKPSAVISAAQS